MSICIYMVHVWGGSKHEQMLMPNYNKETAKSYDQNVCNWQKEG